MDPENGQVENAAEIAEKCFKAGLELLEMEKLDEAYALFCRGIELNPQHAMLQFSLGQAFEAGLGVEKNDYKAVEWYRRAAEQGLIGAMHLLAQKYDSGEGVPYDREEAARWYLSAARGGLPDAQFALGEHYLFQAEIDSRNSERAAFWYRKAAEQGHSNAQLILGGLYEDGRGVQQDLGQAEFWFRKSAEQGNLQAKASLEQFEGD